MSERVEHSPLPWRAIRRQHDGSHMVIDPEDTLCVCTTDHGGMPAAANAEFIARACNSHEELLALCEEAAENLESDDGRYAVGLRARLLAAVTKAKGGVA